MFKLERLKASIYIVFIIPIILMRSNSVELTILSIELITLLFKYEKYAKIFFKEEVAKFPDFTRVKHSILVKEDVEVSYGLIYSLSVNEL
jgi:hypothetical protein